jgi:hypothetical protein
MEHVSQRSKKESDVNDLQEAQVALARLLLSKIRTDRYPSSTQMDLLEQMIPRALASEYFDVLLEKVAADQFPSIPMLSRMSQLTAMM